MLMECETLTLNTHSMAAAVLWAQWSSARISETAHRAMLSGCSSVPTCRQCFRARGCVSRLAFSIADLHCFEEPRKGRTTAANGIVATCG